LNRLVRLPLTWAGSLLRGLGRAAGRIPWRRVLGPLLLLGILGVSWTMIGNRPLPFRERISLPAPMEEAEETWDLTGTLLGRELIARLLASSQLTWDGALDEVPVMARGRMRQGPESLIWPVEGRITSAFGWYRHPLYRDWRYHPGLEFAVRDGEPIRAALGGRVQLVEETAPGYFRVVLEHGDGWQTTYDNLDQVSVGRGLDVGQGQPIGWSGGGSLLFSLRHEGKAVDPRQFVR